jgi:hypothetical protein
MSSERIEAVSSRTFNIFVVLAIEFTDEVHREDLRIRDASASCGYDLGSPAGVPSRRAASRAYERCSLYRRYKGRLPLASILKVYT